MFRLTAKKVITKVISWQARKVLAKYNPKVIAVTGSVGKTSTKDAIFGVMSKKFHVRKSDKSFNSEIGLPLTILGLSNEWSRPLGWIKNFVRGFQLMWFKYPYPQWLVLEVGADKPGDIESVSKWLRADIVVITHIGTVPVHVEFFESIEALIEEKRHLVRALKSDGLLIVDGDDPGSLNSRHMLLEGQKLAICGHHAPADVISEYEELSYDEKSMVRGMNVDILHNEKITRVELRGVVGSACVRPALVAFTIGNYLGIEREAIAKSLTEYEPPRGRKRLVPGIKDSMIIDDSYNASPAALYNGLDILRHIKTRGRKIAIIGDMMELGEYSVDEHYKAGKHAAKICNYLIVVGQRARKIAEGAMDAEMLEANIFEYENSREAGKFAESLIKSGNGDIIFIKGSQSVRMERAVEEIMAHPEDKEKLLVRQEPEWQGR